MVELKIIAINFLIGWIMTQFEPFKWLLKPIKQYGIYKYLYKLISCPKCATLWSGFILCGIYDQNIILAIAASFIADMWDKHFNVIRL